MTEAERYNKLRRDSWNKALHSYGYGYIYGLRGISLNKKINLITFLGIIVPVLIGGIATSYGLNSPVLTIFIIIASPLSLIQLVLSVYSVTVNWNGSYSYYLESSLDNYKISGKYEDIAELPPPKINTFKADLDKIDAYRVNRDDQDNKYPLTDKEKRRGMRYSLRKFRRICAGCNTVPLDMKSTNCGVCGNF